MADIISEKEEYRYILIDSTSASSGLVDGMGSSCLHFLSSGLEMIDSHLQAGLSHQGYQ